MGSICPFDVRFGNEIIALLKTPASRLAQVNILAFFPWISYLVFIIVATIHSLHLFTDAITYVAFRNILII